MFFFERSCEGSARSGRAAHTEKGSESRLSGERGGALFARGLTVVAAAAALFLVVEVGSAAGDPFALFEEGKAALDRGQYDRAVTVFSQTLRLLEPDDSNTRVVLISRAQAYQKKGRLKEAWNDVNRVIRESRPTEGINRANALHIRASLHLRREREKRALEDLTTAIKTPHDNLALRSSSFSNRGLVFIRLGEYDRAVSDLNQAVRLDPSRAHAYATRGLAYLRKNNIEQAQRDARRALSLEPDEAAKNLAEKILKDVSISFSGPDRVIVPIGDDGHIRVRVRFGSGGKPYLFLLDTGATHTLVRRDVLESIKTETLVTEIGTARVRTADGALHRVTRYRVKNAFLYNIPLGDMEVHAFDSDRKEITNLLGTRSLKDVSISIDPGERKAEIRSKEAGAAHLR